MVRIRPARHDDVPDIVAIAAAGGSPDADERYLDLVASAGRLLVAHAGAHADRVLGFAGAVWVGDALMVSDLFVHPDHRSQGIGTGLLRAVTDGSSRRMTCSSTDPGALAAYAGIGMLPQWRLLTLRGRAIGGAPPLRARPWRHDRADLVEYFRSRGAVVDADCVVLTAPVGRDGVAASHSVLRWVSDAPVADADALLRALPGGDIVELSVPEPDPLAAWLLEQGFDVVDHDVFCATDGVHLVPQLRSVHRGLL